MVAVWKSLLVVLVLIAVTAAGGCTEEDVSKMNNNFEDFVSAQEICALDCFFATVDDVDGCFASCMSREFFLTADCSACMGDLVVCGRKNCHSECSAGPSEDACLDCMDAACTDNYLACIGQ